MSKRKIFGGYTSVMLPIFISDTSSTTGGGLSGVTFASSGLVIEYRRAGQSAWTALTPITKTLGTFASPSSSQAGIVVNGALAGRYELDLPDAVYAAGVRFVEICVRGVANMLACNIEIEIDAINYQDSVRAGLTSLPNVNSGSAGAVVTSGTGTAQLATSSGLVTIGSNTDKTGYQVSAMSANLLTASVLATDAAQEIADTLLATVIDNGLTIAQCIRIANSVLAGNATGLASSPVFKSFDTTKNRVVASISGENRTVSSRDGT